MRAICLIFAAFLAAVSNLAADPVNWDSYAAGTPSGKTYPGTGGKAEVTDQKAQVGAWAVYRVLDNGREVSVVRMADVGQDSGVTVYEFDAYSDPLHIAAVQMAVKGLDEVIRTGSLEKDSLVWVKVLGKGGKARTLDGDLLKMAGPRFESMLTANSAQFSGKFAEGGAQTVPAGTFAGTWLVESQMTEDQGVEKAEAWVSSVVPLWHLVKAVNKGGNRVMELVDFGTSGFQSLMP